MIQPITVGRVNHWDIFPMSQRRELSIARIKSRIDQSLRQVGIFAILPSRQFDALDQARSTVEHLLVESITYSRLATGV